MMLGVAPPPLGPPPPPPEVEAALAKAVDAQKTLLDVVALLAKAGGPYAAAAEAVGQMSSVLGTLTAHLARLGAPRPMSAMDGLRPSMLNREPRGMVSPDPAMVARAMGPG